MATFVNIYDMASDDAFIKQVTTACRSAANDILNEGGGVANHAKRLAWAKLVLMANASIVSMMVGGCTGNATLQAGAPSGPWVDGDVQFVVNSLIDAQADSL